MPAVPPGESPETPTPTKLQSSFVRNTFTLSDGQPREFLWACELTEESPEVTWTYDEEDDDLDFISHTLFLRNAVLGVDAKEERNMVEAETKNYAQEEIKVPIVSLTLGKSDMCALDINFSHEIPVTFRLMQGTGPVHLYGQHLAELPPTPEEEDEEIEHVEEVIVETEEESEVEEPEMKPEKPKKRKGKPKKSLTKKRGKQESEESEEEEEVEDEEDEEESMEEEEEEDEPEIKKKSKKAAKKQTTAKAHKAKVKANTGKTKSKARTK